MCVLLIKNLQRAMFAHAKLNNFNVPIPTCDIYVIDRLIDANIEYIINL